MVAKLGPLILSMNAGEQSPLVEERIDVKTLRAGMRKMRNVEPVPQGGCRLMPGSVRRGCFRKSIEVITGLPTATTSNGPHSATAIVYTQTFSAAEPVAAVTLVDWTLSTEDTASARVEVEVGGVWETLGGDLPLTEAAVTFTVGFPPGASKTVAAVRVSLIDPTADTSLTAGTVEVRRETDTLQTPRLESLSREVGQTYTMALVPGFADVWRMDLDTRTVTHVGCFLHAMTAAELAAQHTFGAGETMGFFEENLRTVRVVRRGADHAWQVSDWPYGPIGTVDYGGVYPKTDDVHEITLSWSGTDVPKLSVTVEGEDASAVTYATAPNSMSDAQWATLAADLQTAIRDLPSMTDDVMVSDAGEGGSSKRTIRVTFGGDLSGDEYQVLASINNTTQSAATVTHTEIGKTDGEAIVSDLRGYPATMVEAQQRAIYAGVAARPSALLGSASGEYFNINVQASGADQAFIEALRVDRAEPIYHLMWDKYLIIFTSEGEYFANNRDLSKEQPKNVVDAGSENGSRRSCRPKRIAGEIFYVSGNGEILYAANYDDVQTSYLSAEVSLMASHFVSDVERIEVQRGDSATDGSRLLLKRGDGKLAQAMVIRGQDVFGFSWWFTPGSVSDMVGDKDNVVWLAVEREAPGGAKTICLETMEEGQLLHSAYDAGSSDLGGVVSGLDEFEGQSVWAIADGYVLGPYTVSSAQITLPDPATTVTVGLWQAPYGETLPFLATNDAGDIIRRPGRIATTHMRLVDTTELAVGANGQEPRNVTLTRVGDAVDAPPPAYNGLHKISGMRGHVQGPTLVFTQKRPGSLQIQNLTVEASL